MLFIRMQRSLWLKLISDAFVLLRRKFNVYYNSQVPSFFLGSIYVLENWNPDSKIKILKLLSFFLGERFWVFFYIFHFSYHELNRWVKSSFYECQIKSDFDGSTLFDLLWISLTMLGIKVILVIQLPVRPKCMSFVNSMFRMWSIQYERYVTYTIRYWDVLIVIFN